MDCIFKGFIISTLLDSLCPVWDICKMSYIRIYMKYVFHRHTCESMKCDTYQKNVERSTKLGITFVIHPVVTSNYPRNQMKRDL